MTLTVVEFGVVATLCTVLSLLVDRDGWNMKTFLQGWDMIVFVGFTEATAFVLSALGQMYVAPTRAALLYSLESVTTCVLGYIFLDEILSKVEMFGCFLMFIATLISSLGEVSENDEDFIETKDILMSNLERSSLINGKIDQNYMSI